MIRVDAVVAAEEGLPWVPVSDPGLVDEVAVERALSGVRVRLTDAELAVVAVCLVGRGLGPGRIADRVGTCPERVARVLGATARPGPGSGLGAVA